MIPMDCDEHTWTYRDTACLADQLAPLGLPGELLDRHAMDAVIAEAAYAWFEQEGMADHWPGTAATLLALPPARRKALAGYVGSALLEAGFRPRTG